MFKLMMALLITTIAAGARASMISPVSNCRFNPGSGGDYKMRKHPLMGTIHWHTGVDLTAPTGTPYVAPADGVITEAGFINGRCGYMIEIQHGPGLFTHSCHMKAGGFPPGIRRGVRVTRGQKVAEVGNTGTSRGPHAHFVVKTSSGFTTHMDPYKHVSQFCGVSRSAARGGGGGDRSHTAEGIR